MSARGQTRLRRPPGRREYSRRVLLGKQTHFGPVGSGQPWASFGLLSLNFAPIAEPQVVR